MLPRPYILPGPRGTPSVFPLLRPLHPCLPSPLSAEKYFLLSEHRHPPTVPAPRPRVLTCSCPQTAATSPLRLLDSMPPHVPLAVTGQFLIFKTGNYLFPLFSESPYLSTTDIWGWLFVVKEATLRIAGCQGLLPRTDKVSLDVAKCILGANLPLVKKNGYKSNQ